MNNTDTNNILPVLFVPYFDPSNPVTVQNVVWNLLRSGYKVGAVVNRGNYEH